LSGKDPVSALLWDIDDVLNMAAEHGLKIRGVGFTLYIGGEQESLMMAQAAQVIMQAHQQGLIAVLWVYPRAAHIEDVYAPELIAGAAGLGNVLGADFVKIQMSPTENVHSMQALAIATEAAGNTGVLVSGGEYVSTEELLKRIHEQITQAGTAGCAIGRNLFKRSYNEAIALSKAIAALVYDNASCQEAFDIVRR
jgi:DhnA family fructose-bisphosphate aldolase class Ia